MPWSYKHGYTKRSQWLVFLVGLMLTVGWLGSVMQSALRVMMEASRRKRSLTRLGLIDHIWAGSNAASAT